MKDMAVAIKNVTEEMKKCMTGEPIESATVLLELKGADAVSYRALRALCDDGHEDEIIRMALPTGMTKQLMLVMSLARRA